MDVQTRLRIGIVGCGYQGNIMAKSIQESNDWQVVACADPNPDAAASVAVVSGNPKIYASMNEMLKHSELDAVIVATSHDALFESSMQAIRAGKHILAEKPIGLDEKEAIQLEDAVSRADVCFMSGYSFRYFAAWQKVKELLQTGVVGEIYSVTGSINIGPMSDGWAAHPEAGGGPLLFIGSHLIDQVLWYLGDDPIEVSANIRYRKDTRVDETTNFQVRFAAGALFQGVVSQANAFLINNVDIYGRQGFISLRGCRGVYTVELQSDVLPAYSQLTRLQFPQTPDIRILVQVAQLAEFAQAICEHRQPSCNVTDGRRVLKVLDAIVKSDRSRKTERIC